MTQKESKEKFKREKLLLNKFLFKHYITSLNDIQLECYMNAMKEYAEYYAKRCLEIAYQKGKRKNWEESPTWDLDEETIINLELPEHE
jgi:hypothetical protein